MHNSKAAGENCTQVDNVKQIMKSPPGGAVEPLERVQIISCK